MAVGWENFVEERRANILKRFPAKSEDFAEAVMRMTWNGLSGKARMRFATMVKAENDDGTGEIEVEI